MTTDPFTEAVHDSGDGRYTTPGLRGVFAEGAYWARAHLAAQEESVLMTSREETISDRLSDAGYTEYAEDEDGGVTWVSAPLGEVLRIVSAAQEPTDAEKDAAMDALGCELRVTENGQSTCELHGGYATSDDVCEVVEVALSAARAARQDEEKR